MANNALKKKLERIRNHGWFNLPDHPGDRTIEQQMIGLRPLLSEVKGKAVLDVGCAEGLVGMECAKAGAARVHGIEIVQKHVYFARDYCRELPCTFEEADANHYDPQEKYDVVLMLAVLHKLKDPTASCIRLARACTNLCVVRMGPDKKEVIIDARSDNTPHYIGDTMRQLRFVVETMQSGPFGECTWYYRKSE